MPIHRREVLLTLAGAPLCPLAIGPARAQGNAPRVSSVEEVIAPYTDGVLPGLKGIELHLPGLADNGHVVPARIVVQSPMTDSDHVRQILLLSTRNPVRRMASFSLGPWSGRAEIGTRVRLAGTQTVVALARLSTGELRLAMREVIVTESACLDQE
jgi:sulfur-oxidizing protein SoxY